MLQITEDKAYTACASRAFASRLARENTLGIGALIRRSRDIWFNELSAFDWLEAFRGHPPIGGTSAGSSHTSSSQLSASEQATAVATMTADTARELADYNAKYEARFGHVFLIFAAGRTSCSSLLLAHCSHRTLWAVQRRHTCLSRREQPRQAGRQYEERQSHGHHDLEDVEGHKGDIKRRDRTELA